MADVVLAKQKLNQAISILSSLPAVPSSPTYYCGNLDFNVPGLPSLKDKVGELDQQSNMMKSTANSLVASATSDLNNLTKQVSDMQNTVNQNINTLQSQAQSQVNSLYSQATAPLNQLNSQVGQMNNTINQALTGLTVANVVPKLQTLKSSLTAPQVSLPPAPTFTPPTLAVPPMQGVNGLNNKASAITSQATNAQSIINSEMTSQANKINATTSQFTQIGSQIDSHINQANQSINSSINQAYSQITAPVNQVNSKINSVNQQITGLLNQYSSQPAVLLAQVQAIQSQLTIPAVSVPAPPTVAVPTMTVPAPSGITDLQNQVNAANSQAETMKNLADSKFKDFSNNLSGACSKIEDLQSKTPNLQQCSDASKQVYSQLQDYKTKMAQAQQLITEALALL